MMINKVKQESFSSFIIMTPYLFKQKSLALAKFMLAQECYQFHFTHFLIKEKEGHSDTGWLGL